MTLTALRAAAMLATAAAIPSTAAPLAALPPLVEPMRSLDAGHIVQAMRALPSTGSALYVAAHPDDENTRLIAYLANERLVRTGYLSLTRGGGGQNLIGTEQGDLLGLVRTSELMEARAIDGGVQLFTRAVDYGYSKSAEEALATWGHEEALADVVWAVRRFQPDIIVARFGPNDANNHGHHVASARLAIEAFHAAGDPARFPEQLAWVEPWQAKRVLRNVSTWRLPKNADMSAYLALDVGAYVPALGASVGEIAAQSRSMHKSQGFGAPTQRGSQLEYFEVLAGEPATVDIFDGIDTSWHRWPRAEAFARHAERALAEYTPTAPEQAIPALVDALASLLALVGDAPPEWVEAKRASIGALLVACAGVSLEARSLVPAASPGDRIPVQLHAVVRRRVPVSWAEAGTGEQAWTGPGDLAPNAAKVVDGELNIAESQPISRPHWLASPSSGGLDAVDDPLLRAEPLEAPSYQVEFKLTVAGTQLRVAAPLTYVWTDPVDGERARPFVVAPPLTATPKQRVIVSPNGEARSATWTIRSWSIRPVQGTVTFAAPPGWTAVPPSVDVSLEAPGSEQTLSVSLKPPRDRAAWQRGPLIARADVNGRSWAEAVTAIEHRHIPPRWVFRPAEAILIPLDVKTTARRVAYVPGAGDEVADALEQLGIHVDIVSATDLETRELHPYDAIVFGVRAFNVHDGLQHLVPKLVAYAKAGGVWLVQYTTQNQLSGVDFPIAPAPLSIGRERVTDERAAMSAVDPAHPLLRMPNALRAEDYDGWVQERGLYFASAWEPPLAPIFELADPGEAPLRGALLAARVGRGAYIYTGLSFFRQLPAGVPGAYRLFANLLSYGKHLRPEAP